ncbi:MAG: protein translocase subunit SecF [Oscillospiraceae bacterium]|jgi:preprotein translocase subunit SecF|nr:protein translocase subunit SecF [Oscillospiraceae bacterium]
MKFEIKNRSRVCLTISVAIIALAILLTLFGRGMNIGIDFTGGILFKYEMGESFEVTDIEDALKENGYSETPQIAKSGDNLTDAQIRIKDVDNSDEFRAGLEAKLQEKYPDMEYLSVDRVGAVTGRELVLNALGSVLLAAALMLTYIAIRFDFFSGLAAVIGLLHDILLMCAFMVLLRSFVQVNSTFIAACLTIVGYSINNTIILFDRIRENLRKTGGRQKDREQLTITSVKETMGRTIGTTVTTLIAIVTLYILGVPSTREFALPLIIGICTGLYSATQINGYVWNWLVEHGKNWKFTPGSKKVRKPKKA